jgi:transposase
MVRRHELTDAQWRKIEPLLPGNGESGGRWADHRRVINGVLFRARPGALV